MDIYTNKQIKNTIFPRIKTPHTDKLMNNTDQVQFNRNLRYKKNDNASTENKKK